MAEVEAPVEVPAAPEPFEGGVAAFQKALAKGQASAESQPETAPSSAPAVAPPVPDPATSRVPEKFRGKSIEEVADSAHNAEQRMHQATEEAARLRRENEDFRIRLIAQEQLRAPAPPQSPVDPWAASGIVPEEAVITDTRRFADTTLNMAEERARRAAAEESAKAIQGFRDEQSNIQRGQQQAGALIGTWEAAKAAIRAEGYELSEDQWRTDLDFIAPQVARENNQRDGVIYDPTAYVAQFKRLRGVVAQRAVIPTEGNPPVAARSASVSPSTPGAPTVSREKKQIYDAVFGALQTIDPAKRDEMKKRAMTGDT